MNVGESERHRFGASYKSVIIGKGPAKQQRSAGKHLKLWKAFFAPEQKGSKIKGLTAFKAAFLSFHR